MKMMMATRNNTLPPTPLPSRGSHAHLVQDAGEGVGGVALKGELAVLAGWALRPGLLEEDTRHAVPLARPHRVHLQGDVGGRLGGWSQEQQQNIQPEMTCIVVVALLFIFVSNPMI